MKAQIVFTSGPEGYCPVQAEGTINGFPFYFRSRHEHWSLQVAAYRGGDPFADDRWEHEEEYPGGSASWASKEECIEFINRVAQLWAEGQEEKP